MKRSHRFFLSILMAFAIGICTAAPLTAHAEETPSGENTDGGSISLELIHRQAQSLTLQLNSEHLAYQDVTLDCTDSATGKPVTISLLAAPGTSEYTLYDLETPAEEVTGTLNISMITDAGYQLDIGSMSFSINGQTYASGSVAVIETPNCSVSSSISCREMAAEPETPPQPEDPESETPEQTDPPTETETPGQTDPSTETETPGQTDPSTETETPGQTDSSTETETPGQTNPSTETETPGQTHPSTETETPGQTHPSAESESPLETYPSTESVSPGQDLTAPSAEILTTTPITQNADETNVGVPGTSANEGLAKSPAAGASINETTSGTADKTAAAEAAAGQTAGTESSLGNTMLSPERHTAEAFTGIRISEIVRNVNLVLAALILIVLILLLIKLVLTLKREMRSRRFRRF